MFLSDFKKNVWKIGGRMEPELGEELRMGLANETDLL